MSVIWDAVTLIWRHSDAMKNRADAFRSQLTGMSSIATNWCVDLIFSVYGFVHFHF